MKYIFNVYLFNVLMSISCCFGSDKILISKDVGACCEVHDLMDGNLYGIHTNLCINFFSGNKKLNFFANGSLKYLTSGDFALDKLYYSYSNGTKTNDTAGFVTINKDAMSKNSIHLKSSPYSYGPEKYTFDLMIGLRFAGLCSQYFGVAAVIGTDSMVSRVSSGDSGIFNSNRSSFRREISESYQAFIDRFSCRYGGLGITSKSVFKHGRFTVSPEIFVGLVSYNSLCAVYFINMADGTSPTVFARKYVDLSNIWYTFIDESGAVIKYSMQMDYRICSLQYGLYSSVVYKIGNNWDRKLVRDSKFEQVKIVNDLMNSLSLSAGIRVSVIL